MLPIVSFVVNFSPFLSYYALFVFSVRVISLKGGQRRSSFTGLCPVFPMLQPHPLPGVLTLKDWLTPVHTSSPSRKVISSQKSSLIARARFSRPPMCSRATFRIELVITAPRCLLCQSVNPQRAEGRGSSVIVCQFPRAQHSWYSINGIYIKTSHLHIRTFSRQVKGSGARSWFWNCWRVGAWSRGECAQGLWSRDQQH